MGFETRIGRVGALGLLSGAVLLMGTLGGCTFNHPHPTLNSAGLTPDASPNGIIVRAINPFYNRKALPYALPAFKPLGP